MRDGASDQQGRGRVDAPDVLEELLRGAPEERVVQSLRWEGSLQRVLARNEEMKSAPSTPK